MAELTKSQSLIRDYLLGRVTDEQRLEQIEEHLFNDQQFAAAVESAEDEIINDYVMDRLTQEDAQAFEATLRSDRERRFKLELTKGLRDRARLMEIESSSTRTSWLSPLAVLRRPAYAGALAMVLIAAVVLTIFLISRRRQPDDLAELRSIYSRSRPTETRISSFDYAPFNQLRGAPEPREQNRLRRLENDFISQTEQQSNATTHYELGTFYVTQQKPRDAIRELEAALKSADKDARIHNELGSAHFQLAGTGPRENKLEELARSLEQFTKATELDPNLLEALFNRALVLQEMSLPQEAKEAWTRYLKKDSTSPWADEARRHLSQIKDEPSLFKTDAQVLSDFLTAFRGHDNERAEQIHDETKGFLRSVTVPLQLSRRYLEATRNGDEPAAKESLAALVYLGEFEQSRHGDAFFLSSPGSFRASAATRLNRC